MKTRTNNLKTKPLKVQASPFNAVKLDLAIIIIAGMLLFMIIGTFTAAIGVQLLILFIYGMLSLGWLIYKTRRVIQGIEQSQ